MTVRTLLGALGACSLLSIGGRGVAASVAASRHNRLVKAEPAVEGTVAASPKQIRLWFKEPPEASVSGAENTSIDDSSVAGARLGARCHI